MALEKSPNAANIPKMVENDMAYSVFLCARNEVIIIGLCISFYAH